MLHTQRIASWTGVVADVWVVVFEKQICGLLTGRIARFTVVLVFLVRAAVWATFVAHIRVSVYCVLVIGAFTALVASIRVVVLVAPPTRFFAGRVARALVVGSVVLVVWGTLLVTFALLRHQVHIEIGARGNVLITII